MAQDSAAERADSGERKRQLIRTVYRVMARQGVHRVPMQTIATEAGVSKGLLVYHFGTKDAMVLAAMDWVLEATATRIRRSIDSATPDTLLRAVLDAIWIDPVANRDFFSFYLDGVEHLARSPEFSEFGVRNQAVIEGLYAEVIAMGVGHGVFDVDEVDVAAVQMRSVIDGTFLQWMQVDGWRDSHRPYRNLCERTLERVLDVADPAT